MTAETNNTAPRRITVFISYSHESKSHVERIRSLAERLMNHGFACKIDQFEKDPSEGWPEWSENQIASADFVLVAFTANYSQPQRDQTAEHGRGRVWEWRLIRQHLYESYGVAAKVIPIVFTQEDRQHVAAPLKGNQTYRLYEADGFTELVERLTRVSWEKYSGLFRFGEFRVAFVPYLNRAGRATVEFAMNSASVILSPPHYQLPAKFASTAIDLPKYDGESCRLDHFARTGARKIQFSLSQIRYSDYLKSGEHLDDPLPGQRNRTFRQEFARLIPQSDVNLRNFGLTNICGVGLFIVTRDRMVLICRHSPESRVYPLRWTFSASGTMRWGAWPNPFTEVIWKCREETNHQINPANLKLIELGADARKLFFECCFLEETNLTSTELARRLPSTLDHEMLPLHPVGELVERIIAGCWEPAAEAVLLMLAAREHGTNRILDSLESLRAQWKQHYMVDEWDLRASRQGSLAVMSVRYPPRKLEAASKKYVRQVMQFIRNDIEGKRVLEVGSGIGRITRELVRVVKSVTCIDLCERMNQRNEHQLGKYKDKVRIEKAFIQEFNRPKLGFDIALCSLVLVHNVSEEDFERAISVMCKCADIVFVFEDVSRGRGTSPNTRLCSVEALKTAFAQNGFNAIKERIEKLFDDNIAFLKFVRQPRR